MLRQLCVERRVACELEVASVARCGLNKMAAGSQTGNLQNLMVTAECNEWCQHQNYSASRVCLVATLWHHS